MAPRTDPHDESRASRRFVPAHSVDASIVDRNLHIIHGMVANLSEAGASLLTCRSIEHGSYVGLKLSRSDNGLVDTLARVVWTWQGIRAHDDGSGSLVGLSFCGLSAEERTMIWTCSMVPPPRAKRGPVSFPFDELSEPEVEWFLAREVDSRNLTATERRAPSRQSSSGTPPFPR